MTQRFFVEIAFDGTNYFGWQIQPRQISVQEKIQAILSKIYNTPISVVGCGRTDTGVHAKQYFFHFDAPFERPNLKESFKMMLPEDISLIAIHKVSAEAHARYDATSRSYTYFLHHKKDIFKRYFSLGADLKALDEEKINAACHIFLTQKNYLPLCKKNPNLSNHLSDVQAVSFEFSADKTSAVFKVSANRFLHNQIRRMLGVLINIGLGKTEVAELEDAMINNTTLRLNDTVSAHALFLHTIKYPYICTTNDENK